MFSWFTGGQKDTTPSQTQPSIQQQSSQSAGFLDSSLSFFTASSTQPQAPEAPKAPVAPATSEAFVTDAEMAQSEFGQASNTAKGM